jgi:Sulfotransferase family
VSAWHTFVDSDSFRWFAKRGPGRPFFRSAAFRNMKVRRNRVIAARAARREPDAFADVRTFCVFVGHNKSGTSLLGGLLDAHRQVILADEADALQYVDAGFDRDELFHVLLRGSRAEARKGRVTARRLVPYSYAVPGQWQGRAEGPRVVGDSTTGTSTRRLGEDQALLDRVERLARDVDVKFIQVIRNPFDPISVMMVRGHRSFENAIEHYFSACATLVALRRRVDPAALLPVRYEDAVADPAAVLRDACAFVGVEPDREYIDACTGIVRTQPDRSRDMVEWTRKWIDVVERRTADFAFLDGYSYEN